MAGMANLYTVEPRGLELTQLGFGAVLAQMRGDGHPTHFMNQPGDPVECREGFGYVTRFAATQEAGEGIAEVIGRPAPDQRAGNVRTPQCPVLRFGLDVGEIDGHAGALQAFDHFVPTALSGLPGFDQKGFEGLVPGREEVPEEMHLPPGCLDAEFTARDDPKAERRRSRGGSAYAVERVMIGEGDGHEVRLVGPGRHLLWRTLPIRRGGVAMQINVRRTRSPGRSTRAASGGTARAAGDPRARSGRPQDSGCPWA